MAALAPLAPYVMAAGTAFSTISEMGSMKYQAAVAQNNANMMAETALRERHAADQDMQQKDGDARAEIAAMMSEMDASGLNSSSGSMLMRRAGAESLASRDRERLGQKRDTQFENTKRQEESYRAEAKALKKRRGMAALTGLLTVPTSFLSGASMLNQYTAGRMGLENASIVGN